MRWDDLFNNGSVVDLSASMWRAKVKLKASDLGIDDSPEVKQALSLGCHRLLPSKAFEEIVAAARECRNLVDQYSMNFGLIRGARFVPNKNVGKLMTALRTEKTRFYEAVDRFLDNYETGKEEMLPVIEKALRDAARSDEAAARAFRRIRQEYPTREEVLTRFQISWSIYQITSPRSREAAEAIEGEGDNVKSMVRSMVEQLRGEMTTKLADLLKLIERGGKLPERSIKSAVDLLDRLEGLNVFGDAALAEQIRTVRSWIEGVEGGKPGEALAAGIADVKRSLEEGLEAAVAEAEASLTGVGKRKLAPVKAAATRAARAPVEAEAEEADTSLEVE